MYIYESKKYQEEIRNASNVGIPWNFLQNCSIVISGASGLIGTFLVDVLMYKNLHDELNCTIYAIGRNREQAFERFRYCWNNKNFYFIPVDISERLSIEKLTGKFYMLHLASNTHPIAYASDPVGTIIANVFGLKNMLDFAVKKDCIRFAFASSNEIYGKNRGDVELFSEDYCGYIDPNTLRAGYTESKRCGEALCQAYIKQYGVDIVIPRLTRSFGPTMKMTDTKAMSQFLKNALEGSDIILKSAGTQFFSYTYVADAVTGLLTVLLKGKTGEAYNISDGNCDITLKDLAKMIANHEGRAVVFQFPSEIERVGFSIADKARLNSKKINQLGWKAEYTLKSGIHNTLSILKEIRE